MDKNIEEKNLNKQKQEELIQNLDGKSNKLNSSLGSHESMQNDVLGRLIVPAQVQAEIANSTQNLFDTYDEIFDERSLLDTDDPEFIAKDLDLVKERFKAQVEYSREKDLAIQKVVNQPLTSLEEAWEDREDKYREFKHAAQTVKENVAKGVELDKLIEKSESDLNKKSDSIGSNNQSTVNTDQGSSSLVEDFANPNLEQPSYMDPDD